MITFYLPRKQTDGKMTVIYVFSLGDNFISNIGRDFALVCEELILSK